MYVCFGAPTVFLYLMCFYILLFSTSKLFYFEEMKHECSHNVQIRKTRCPAEPDPTIHQLDQSKPENPASLSECSNAHFSPRSGTI